MPLTLTRYHDAEAFGQRAEPYLMRHEAAHCLPIGIITTLRRHETVGATGAQGPYLALVEDEAGEVVAAAVVTPPYNLILSRLADDRAVDEVIGLLMEDLRLAIPTLPGVQAPGDLARRFAERWSAHAGGSLRLNAEERIYQLTAVTPPAHVVAGAMRRIEERDRPLLRAWLRAFMAEALHVPDDQTADTQINRRLRFESSGMYLWEVEGAPVALAGYGGPTPHGIRIGPVYTPPELRGRGYASALTAALSQRLLAEGRQVVFLFTDLANPTSNHIYQQVGYRPVGDVSEYAFTPAEW